MTGPYTELCECGHRAVDHSICWWLPQTKNGYSPIGTCFCGDCHDFKGIDPNGVMLGRRQSCWSGPLQVVVEEKPDELPQLSQG